MKHNYAKCFIIGKIKVNNPFPGRISELSIFNYRFKLTYQVLFFVSYVKYFSYSEKICEISDSVFFVFFRF